MKSTPAVSTLLAALLAVYLFLPAVRADDVIPSAEEARQLALRAYTEAAQEGDAEARFKLGWLYEQGQWVAKDPAQAAHWYRLAADQGETVAQYNLALLLLSGSGVAKDPVQAVAWLRKSADLGLSSAQLKLAEHQTQATPEQLAAYQAKLDAKKES